jgi:N-acetylglucosamine kinase-like BadF-type ATPase
VGQLTEPVVVAVDGGGSKTDAVALTLGGGVIGRASAAGSSPHFIGVDGAVALIDQLVRQVACEHPIEQVNVYLSGLDLPSEVDTFTSALRPLDWFTQRTVAENDLYALLRTGTSAADAVAVVCGTGINALGVRADGAVARFAALGTISGDWGGGTGIGESAVWHASRDADRRGPFTSLTAAVPEAFGLGSIADVTEALHLGQIAYGDLGILSPIVFAHADEGDEIAASLVDRQGSEVALMAASCLSRLDLLDVSVPVVLGGGILATRHERLWAAIHTTLGSRAPLAVTSHIAAPPIVGAALLALERVGASAAALTRARASLEA